MIGGNSIFSDDVTCEVAAGVLEVGSKVCFVLGQKQEEAREDECKEMVSSNNKVNGPI